MFGVAELSDELVNGAAGVAVVTLVAEDFDAGSELSEERFGGGEDHAKARESVLFEESSEFFSGGERPVKKKDVIIAKDEEHNFEDFKIGAAKMVESVDHDEHIAVRVEILCVEHARSDTSEGSDVGVAVMGDEDTIEIPGSEKAEDIEDSVGKRVSGQIRV
jgi:hypothetical protein